MRFLIVKLLASLAVAVLFCAPAMAQTCTGASPGSCVFQDDGVPKEFPTLGENGGTAGSVKLMGSGTGYVLVGVPTGSITSYNFTLPATAGTSGYLLTSAAGSGAMTWTSPTVQVNGVNCTIGSTCTISASAGTISIGVTTIASGASGAILYNNAGVLGNVAQVPLTAGGTNASLVASNGGIFYSTGSAGAILSGTATANQVLLSGSSTTPAWSTATYPATTTANQLLYSSSSNTIAGLATANSGVLITSAGGVPSIASTLPGSLTIPSPTVTGAFTATGLVTLGDLATQSTNTVLGNATSGSASPTALAVGSCSSASNALSWTTNSGFGCNTSITAAAMPASGLTGQVALANGGTNGNLSASNGGIFYSTASAGAILAGTATANQMLMSGASAAPSWSPATWPNTVTQGQMLNASGTNVWAATNSPTLGVNGVNTGALNLATATLGGASISIQNGGATSAYNFNLPTTAGTSAFVLTSAGGSGPMTWTSPTVTINTTACTIGGSCTISASNSIVIGSSAISGGTNGRVLYDNAGTAGEYPVTGSAGNVVLSTSPSISGLTVTSSFTASGLVTNSSLANMTANTVKCNATNGSSAPSDCKTFPLLSVSTHALLGGI